MVRPLGGQPATCQKQIQTLTRAPFADYYLKLTTNNAVHPHSHWRVCKTIRCGGGEDAMTIAEHFIGANSNESNARRRAGAVLARLTAVSCLAMGLMLAPSYIGATAFARDRADAPPLPWTGPVPQAHCGPHDRTESGLQASTTLAERVGDDTDLGVT